MLFRRNLSNQIQVSFERIRIEEVLSRLDQRHTGIFEESHCLVQEPTHGHMVRIKNRNQFPVSSPQRMVQVAGFGMVIVRAADVHCAQALRHDLNCRPAPIVENVNGRVRVIDGSRADDGPANDIDGFVIGRNENIDRGKRPGRERCAFVHLNGLKVTEEQNQKAVDFRHQKQQ